MIPISNAIIESYYLETREGLFFAVKGLEHPPDRVIAILRYAPDFRKGERRKGDTRYCRFYHFGEQSQLLQISYPQYIAFDPVFQTTLQSVPKSDIQRVYDPVSGLQDLMRSAAASGIEEDACAFARMLHQEANVPWPAIGISGSLLIGLHTEHSDLDFSVFGIRNSWAVYTKLRSLLDAQSIPDLSSLGPREIEELYRQRSTDTPMPFDAFAKSEKAKVCQGSFRGRPYFIRFLMEGDEAATSYGDVLYSPLGQARISAIVVDDHESIFTPCRYGLSEARILEGPLFPVSEIVSFRGRFCEQARAGDRLLATGALERLEDRQGRTRYRLLLGGSPGDTLLVSGR
jgi:uncharacterized protein